jgi:hypothetical protein
MVTKLQGLLKRELAIKGRAYVVAIDESGIKLTLKGHRLGQELKWVDFVSGDAALAIALNASLARGNDADRASAPTPSRKRGKSKKSASKKKAPA